MNGRTPSDFLNILDKHFNNADLRELAREIGTEYENLAGDTKRGRLLSLIEFAEQHDKTNILWELVIERRPFLRSPGEAMQMGKLTIDTIKWIALILGLIAAVITIGLWLSENNSGDRDEVLLTVQVNSEENQTPIFNAKVTVDLPGEIISPKRTDINGRAVFSLNTEADGDLARVMVETSEVKTQNISIKAGMGAVEFQMKP